MRDIACSLSFEQGPIRPPSEAGSLLLRFTRNCPWNKCTFCPVYKGSSFSRRSLEEIKKDIDTVAAIIGEIHRISWFLGEGGEITSTTLQYIMAEKGYSNSFRHVAYWLYLKTYQVFIQDANSLIMKTDDLADALVYLRKQIPSVKRITSYGRSSTLRRKSLEELKVLKEAGLDRIHVGMESGSEDVLEFVQKGATQRDHIEGGCKVKEAGITLSEYVMPGLGGKQWGEEHALETAKVLNAVRPDFIRLRTLQVPPFGKLCEDVREGRFVPLKDDEIVREIRLLIDKLDSPGSVLTSDHIRNLLEDVEGKLPEDKSKMLALIDEYLGLPEEDRLLFRLGRRGGGLRSLMDFKNPYTKMRLSLAKKELEDETGKPIESIIDEMSSRYL